MKQQMINESLRLYRDIDSCISKLLKARSPYDAESEMKAFNQMEGLMVGTLQHLSYMIDHLKDVEFTKWIKVEDRLPEINENVLCVTKGGRYMINSMYIPKNCYGNILGAKEWRGSSVVKESITHWMPITPPKED